MRRVVFLQQRCALLNDTGRHIWHQGGLKRRRRHQLSTYAAATPSRGSRPSSFRLDPLTGQIFDNNQAPSNKKNNKNNAKQKPRFQTIVGLEIHAQLDIPTKLFSPASVLRQNKSSSTPNVATTNNNNSDTSYHPPLHPLDVAVPGYLPVLSKEAVQAAVLAAAILNCHIQPTSRFERKHYAYADLAPHYQITQQRWPLALDGEIEASVILNPKKQSHRELISCRIQRLQLEQDTAKTITTTATTTTTTTVSNDSNGNDNNNSVQYKRSCVDFNRAGSALIEIVLHPDLRTPRQAAAVTDAVRQLLKHARVCDGRMEEGSLRCDVNVNIEEIDDNNDDKSDSDTPQQPKPRRRRRRSPRVEVKNLNSIKQVRDAVEYEVLRQAREWRQDNMEGLGSDNDQNNNSTTVSPSAETRMWNLATRSTELIRRKDEEQDYRFLPEPDLPPLILESETSSGGGVHVLDGMDLPTFLKARLPELPAQAAQRLQEMYGLTAYQAKVVVGDPPAIAYLDQAIAAATNGVSSPNDDEQEKKKRIIINFTINLLINELFALVKETTATSDSNIDEDESEESHSVRDSEVSAEQLGQIVVLLTKGTLSKDMAKKLLRILYRDEKGGIPAQVAAERGFELVSDPIQLRALCQAVLDQHPEELQLYAQGGKMKRRMIKFFGGAAMSASKGNAEPEMLQEILLELLEDRSKS